MSQSTHHTTTTTKQIPVHKMNEEGVITIDALTGMVDRSEGHELPEWASELVCAQLTERTLWHTNAFGPEFARTNAIPEMFAFEELGWLTFTEDEHGNGVEGYTEASKEHRMEVMATVLGVDLSELDETKAFAALGKLSAEVEIALDTNRTSAEMKSLTESLEGRFEAVSENEVEYKTGTHGR